MEIEEIVPPRTFGAGSGIEISHTANVRLDPDEQVTFTAESGAEHDVARKSWGYYATSSLNGRLSAHGLRAALVVNDGGKLFLHLVEEGRDDDFGAYLDAEGARVVTWLDSDEAVAEAVARLDADRP